MKGLLKPLRVVAAVLLFFSINAAFLAPIVSAALFLDAAPDFTWTARLQFLPALLALNVVAVIAVLAVTLLFGRVYCSTVCPLGVLQDVFIRLRRPFAKRGFSADRSGFRWIVPLAVLVPLAFCGVTALASALDPFSAYGRLVANLVRPAFQWAVNCGAAWSDAHEKYWLMSGEIAVPAAIALAVSALTLVFVAVLAFWKGRWLCNRLCPVGGCLALASARSLVRLRIVSAKCVGCGVCERGCKSGAIDFKAKDIDNSRCVRCFNCLGACRKGAIGR